MFKYRKVDLKNQHHNLYENYQQIIDPKLSFTFLQKLICFSSLSTIKQIEIDI
jgi:hypothetical protein